jgi:hypothetical protein
LPNLRRTVACDGISIQVPSDWNIAALNAQTESGYLRLDDDQMPRLELKWVCPSTAAEPDLLKLKRRYVASLQRSAKKSRSQLTVEDQAQSLGQKGRKAKNYLSFRWQASQQGVTLVSSCNACGRQVLAQLYAPLGDNIGSEADAIFSTLHDHSPDHLRSWSIYDFFFKVPPDFHLLSQNLLLGRLELAFQKLPERLVFSQWAVAQTHLGHNSLLEWFQTHLVSRAKGFDLKINETTFRNHPALFIKGHLTGYKSALQMLSTVWKKKEPALQLLWHLWHCPQLNRLFSLQGFLLPANESLLDQLVQEVKCH